MNWSPWFKVDKAMKDKIAIGLGASLDWYDFALYGFFASIFAKQFFPQDNYDLAIFASFATWFIGFAVRPIGAIIFGHLGDKYGRVFCFRITSVLIFVPIFLFPLLPTYAQIGSSATYLLIFLRIIQGICIGGEFAGNIIYLCESSPKEKRYFFGSIGSCAGSFGILMASITATIIYAVLPEPLVATIGWRIAFSFAVVLSIISYKMRKTALETSIFKQLKDKNKIVQFPLKTSVQENWREYLMVLGILYLHATSFYMIFIFLPTYLKQYTEMSNFASLANNSGLLLLRLFIIPIIGTLCDKKGNGLKFIIAGSVSFLIFSYPMFMMINSSESAYIITGIIMLSLFTTLNAGSIPGFLISLAPANIRYTLFSLAFNIGYGLFGGIVPMISIYLINASGNKLAPAIYLSIASIITLGTCFYIYRRNKKYV